MGYLRKLLPQLNIDIYSSKFQMQKIELRGRPLIRSDFHGGLPCRALTSILKAIIKFRLLNMSIRPCKAVEREFRTAQLRRVTRMWRALEVL